MSVSVKLEGAALETVSELIDEFGEYRVQEALTRLELALEDEGWNRLGAQSQYDFSRTGLKKIIDIARAMFLANPLINHAVMIQTDYVWAQGVNITPKAELLAPVVSRFIDHKGNKRELTGHQARILKEIALQTDGNLFLVLFTNRSNGFVRVRSVNVDQIAQIVKNPEDDHEPWYYLRQWTPVDPKKPDQPGTPTKAFYPDWLYRPKYRPKMLKAAGEDTEVLWDSPMYHLKVGCTDQMTFGVPEVYAALDWARAVVQTLEDYATIRRAHARFAWRFTTKSGPKGVQAAKSKLATTLDLDRNEGNPPPVTGSTFIAAEGNQLEPIKTAAGAAPPDEARRMWLMVGAATGTPETMLSGDATVGNYATAKSLDRPTELKMRDRQTLWSEVLGDIFGYVIDQAALCPNGPLRGKKLVDAFSDEVVVQVIDPATKQAIDRRIDVDFPPILERDAKSRIDAVVAAYNSAPGATPSGLLDLRTAARLILSALGENNIDEVIAKILGPDEPNPPITPDEPMPPAGEEGEPSSTIAPPAPLDVTVPNPGGPIDSPTAANSTI